MLGGLSSQVFDVCVRLCPWLRLSVRVCICRFQCIACILSAVFVIVRVVAIMLFLIVCTRCIQRLHTDGRVRSIFSKLLVQ